MTLQCLCTNPVIFAGKVPTAFEKYVSNSRLAAPVGQNAPTGLRCSPSKSGDQYGGGRGSQRSSLNIGVLSESLPSRLRDASGSLLRLGGWQHLEGGCQPGLRPRLRAVTRGNGRIFPRHDATEFSAMKMPRITRYADRLLDDLVELDWPESTLTM